LKKLALFIVFIAAGGFLAAQTAEERDLILNTEEITCSQAAWFVLTAADAGSGDTFTAARENRWLPGRAEADSPIRLGELSLLIMRAFGLKGGVMYTLFPVPRYAFRELVYTQIIQGKNDSGSRLDGRDFLQILGRVLTYVEEEEALARQRVAGEINARLKAMHIEDTRAVAGSEGITISLFNINFQANSTRLEAQEQRKIQNIAEILKIIPGRKMLIAGHTALAGTREGQIQISTGRAQAVADYLIQLGARKPEEITVRGYGAERPVADNTTAEGLALNRRVEIIILEQP
jgi:outer membrane protein OmpA-like peptidoglycan-associated protein